MKRSKRTLVRVICIVLTILMCASMVHVTAFAAVLEDDPVGENGPSSTAAYVAISDGFIKLLYGFNLHRDKPPYFL